MRVEWVDAIFAKLQAIYGSRWLDQYQTTTMLDLAREEWALALADMGPEGIRTALDHCRKESQWPPTPAEFLRAGKPKTIPLAHRRNDQALRLPRHTSEESRQMAQENLQRMREKLDAQT